MSADDVREAAEETLVLVVTLHQEMQVFLGLQQDIWQGQLLLPVGLVPKTKWNRSTTSQGSLELDLPGGPRR